MNISHIVTVGCSLTYCQGLEIKYGWPSLLANKLDCNLVNLALPGIGNDAITRRLTEYLYNNLSYNNTPFVIVSWSQPWRREFWHEKIKYNGYIIDFKDYNIISLPDATPNNSLEQALIDNLNDEDSYRRSLLYKINIINLLENLNIPYIMTNNMPQRDDETVCALVDSKFPKIAEKIYNDKFYVDQLYMLTREYPKLPCGHEGVESNLVAANYIKQKINELHPNCVFEKTQNFYPLQEFSKLSKLNRMFPEWCSFTLDSDKIN